MHDPELEPEQPSGQPSAASSGATGDVPPLGGARELSITDMIAAIGAQVPLEEWDDIPADLSSRPDDYFRAIP